MATVSKKSVKRTATKKKAKADKAATKNDSAAVIRDNDEKIAFNANAKSVREAIAYGINIDTTQAASSLLASMKLFIIACQRHDMSPKHCDKALKAIRDGVIAKYKRNGGAIKLGKIRAQRVSEMASILKLYRYSCIDALLKSLADFDTLTFEGFVAISRWMRRGAKGNKPAHPSDLATPPSTAKLRAVLKGMKGRTSKTNTRRRKVRGAMPGFPTGMVEGLAHIATRVAKYEKLHAKHLGAGERSLIAAMRKNLVALVKPVRAASVKLAAKSE